MDRRHLSRPERIRQPVLFVEPVPGRRDASAGAPSPFRLPSFSFGENWGIIQPKPHFPIMTFDCRGPAADFVQEIVL